MNSTQNTSYRTIRSDCGKARATYRPDWGITLPWVTYINGTAGRHAATEREAISILESKGFSFRGKK